MNKKANLICLLALVTFLFSELAKAQNKELNEDQKVILITLDGMRWQELFSGADSLLIENKNFVENPKELKAKFWRETAAERRKILFPFLWSTVQEIGQLHGNRGLKSNMNLTNKMWFSYPGYNEILSGHSDDINIRSNDKFYNPNTTILEIINQSKAYRGKVAAFGSWDVFPYIINTKRSGIDVNAGFSEASDLPLSDKEVFLNTLQNQVPSPWESVRLDAFTHNYALEYMKKRHPNLVYLAYGETDDFAHDGKYDAYLKSANTTDSFIQGLWNYLQSDSFYKNKTTVLITTDHGRGTIPIEEWKSHGSKIKGADQVWFVCFGAKVSAVGEVKDSEQLYSNQIAATIAKILGVSFSELNTGKPLSINH